MSKSIENTSPVYADERMQLMLDTSPMAIGFFDSRFNAVDCNLAAIRMYGLSDKSDYQNDTYRLMPPFQPDGRGSKKLFQAYLQEAFNVGRAKHEFISQKLDGVIIYTEITFVRAELKGEPIVISYSVDLSDILIAREREREGRETADLLQSTLPAGYARWSQQGYLIDVNQQALDLFGLAKQEEYFKKATAGYFSQSIDKDNFLRVLEEGRITYENTYTLDNGDILTCEITLIRVIRRGTIQVMAYMHDLREAKKAMEQASEATKRAKMMLDATPLACFLINQKYYAIDCNQEAIDLFGFNSKEDAILRWRDIFPKYDQYGKPLELTPIKWDKNAPPMHMEMLFVDMLGNEIPCAVTITFLEYQGELIAAAYSHDLREMRAMAAEMKRIDIAEQENRAKTQFLARMSHEIRTPMNTIMGLANMHLVGNTPKPPHEIDEAFMKIHSSGNILLGLINKIIDLSKAESGNMEINNMPYELASVIHDTAMANAEYVGSKDIRFELVISENLPRVLMGDAVRIEQVLNHLLSNAFKYTIRGTVTFKVDIEEQSLIISISDTGRGMNSQQIETLFTSTYINFNDDAYHYTEGTGIGMTIVYHIIKRMNGHIKVDSLPGKGSTFTIRLPQDIVGDEVFGQALAKNLENFQMAQTAFKQLRDFEHEPMPYGKVLVVDDIENNLFVAKGLMMPFGLQIETAANGYEAIERVRNGNVYDIIFMDHMMPGIDGIETTKNIQKLGYAGPIVALTANAVLGQSEMFMNNGFSGFVSKPIHLKTLHMYLLRFIRDKYPEEAAKATGQSFVKSSDFSAELISSFLRDADKVIKSLTPLQEKSNWNEKDFELYTILTHGIKSACANVDYHALSKFAASLEVAGQERNRVKIKTDTPQFLQSLQNAMTVLQPKAQMTEVLKTECDADFLQENLRKLQLACGAYHKKDAKIALEALKKCNWPQEISMMLDKLSTLLLHGEFEEIEEVIAKCNILEVVARCDIFQN